MNPLLKEVFKLKNSSIGKKVEIKLVEFKSFKHKNTEEWFSELCFCILTANSKALTAMKIQEQLGFKGFSEYSEKKIARIIKNAGHRFHNNKAKYIVLARDYIDIKWIISGIIHDEGSKDAREWLVENIKGIGYKEASHFLRNTGFFDLAILDRHIFNLMIEYNYLEKKPTSITRNKYLEIEKIFKKIAEEANMSIAELDLYMWSLKVGDVLK